MSLDYPEYQELPKKSRFLALIWHIGDYGYYIGLFGAVGSPLGMIFTHFSNRKANLNWQTTLLGTLLLTSLWIVVFWGSAQLKGFSLKRGEVLKNKR